MTSKTKLFKIKELFTIYKGTRLIKDAMVDGSVNYLGAIDNNNGVRQQIDILPKFQGNYITVNYNGSVGEAFYQREPFWASDDVNVLKLKGHILNEKIAMYIITVIKANKKKFSYGRKWTMEKMYEEEILLPVDTSGNPNWKYMENYIDGLGIKLPKTKNNVKNSLVLNIQEWKEFKLSDIFDITYGNKFDLGKMSSDSPEINFISRTANNCGIVGKVDTVKGKNPFNAGCMTIALGGSIGSTFYQSERFYTAQNVAVLKDKDGISISKFAKLFIKTIIELEVGIKFRAFGRELNKHIKNNFPISLPVTINETPDWQFMENYIKSLPYADII